MNQLNCPNCGAPITGEKCPYCGTVFLDFAAIQIGAPSFVKFLVGDSYILARLVVDNLDMDIRPEMTEYTDGFGAPIRRECSGHACHFHLDAHAVMAPDERTLVTVVVPDK